MNVNILRIHSNRIKNYFGLSSIDDPEGIKVLGLFQINL